MSSSNVLEVFRSRSYCPAEVNSYVVKNSHEDLDVLQAVKLDPAVLEARVMIDAGQDVLSGPETVTRCDEVVSEKKLEYDEMMSMHQAALLSLTPQHFDLLLKYVGTLRKQRQTTQKHLECGFCKNNGMPVAWYSTHSLKNRRGRVRCPELRRIRCPHCGATGDYAHTIKYCPENNWDLWNLSNFS